MSSQEEPKKKTKERTVVGVTNRPKQPKDRKPLKEKPFRPQEPSHSPSSVDRMMGPTRSSEATVSRRTDGALKEEHDRATAEVEFFDSKPGKHRPIADSVTLHPDPGSPLFEPPESRFTTTKAKPNDRVDAKEIEVRRQREAAKAEAIRRHEAEMAASLGSRETKAASKEESHIETIRQQRESYEKAVDERRKRDSRASHHTTHDVPVAEALAAAGKSEKDP